MIEKLNINFSGNILINNSYGNSVYIEPAETRTPFFVLLHSLGKNENQTIKFSEFLPKNAYVLSIRGFFPWRVDGDDSYAWFDIKGGAFQEFCKEDDLLKSVNYVINIIEDFKIKIPNLDDPIIIGFSQGGMVGLTMAVENYYKVKALWCHCGYYEVKLDKKLTGIKTKILMTNGIHDYVIPTNWAEYSYNLLKDKCEKFECELLECAHEINNTVISKFKIWQDKIYD